MLELVQLKTPKQYVEGETALHAELRQFPFAPAWERKTFLPKRARERRFAPRQYYYAASKSGVVPSLPLSAAVSHAA
jgi:hypothetical protein